MRYDNYISDPGRFTAEELRMIEDAKWEQWEDIAPERATNPEVREILSRIQITKRHRQRL